LLRFTLSSELQVVVCDHRVRDSPFLQLGKKC
jgi:hypothetical protein